MLVLEFRNIPGSGAQEPGREGAERALNQLDQGSYQDLTSERPSINPESGQPLTCAICFSAFTGDD